MKTKAMHEGDDPDPRPINIGNDPVKLVTSFPYLSSEDSNSGDLLTETNRNSGHFVGVMRGIWITLCWRRDILRCTKRWHPFICCYTQQGPRFLRSWLRVMRSHDHKVGALVRIFFSMRICAGGLVTQATYAPSFSCGFIVSVRSCNDLMTHQCHWPVQPTICSLGTTLRLTVQSLKGPSTKTSNISFWHQGFFFRRSVKSMRAGGVR